MIDISINKPLKNYVREQFENIEMKHAKVATVLLRINAGGVHLIFDFFGGAFIQGRRLYEGGVYYKIQKKLQFYISRSMISLSSILKTALSASSTPGICDQIERVRTTRFV